MTEPPNPLDIIQQMIQEEAKSANLLAVDYPDIYRRLRLDTIVSARLCAFKEVQIEIRNQTMKFWEDQ